MAKDDPELTQQIAILGEQIRGSQNLLDRQLRSITTIFSVGVGGGDCSQLRYGRLGVN